MRETGLRRANSCIILLNPLGIAYSSLLCFSFSPLLRSEAAG